MYLFVRVDEPDVETLTDVISGSGLGVWDYLRALIILVAAIVCGRLARMVVRRIVQRTGGDSFLADLLGRVLGYVIVAFGLVYALESLGIAFTPVLGALGIVGFALAFALQDILANFVAGIILQVRRRFRTGDEIRSGDFEGAILEIDARTVTIRTPDGETVRLPSAEVIKHAIVNHTQYGRRRTTIDVGVAYGSDLDRAALVAREATESVDAVLDTPAPEVLVHTFADSSVDLAVRFWHEPTIADQWRTRDQVARAVAAAFVREGIEIPFPQRVLHSAPAEDDVESRSSAQ